jgi:hypothetical protein
MKTSLKNINLALQLIDELYFLIDDYSGEADSDIFVEEYKMTVRNLEEAIKVKLDNASYHLLLAASKKIDPETLNFDIVTGDSRITHCVWANLSHNPK